MLFGVEGPHQCVFRTEPVPVSFGRALPEDLPEIKRFIFLFRLCGFEPLPSLAVVRDCRAEFFLYGGKSTAALRNCDR